MLKSRLYRNQVKEENTCSVQEMHQPTEDFANKQPHFCT